MGEGRGESHFSSSTHTGGPPVRAQVVGTSPVGCAVHRGTRPVYVRSATGAARGPSSYGPNCTALTGSECSAAGWLAFGIPSACALTWVASLARSPSLASRARLLAPRPRRVSGFVCSAERGFRGRWIRPGREFCCRARRWAARLCSEIGGRRRGRGGAWRRAGDVEMEERHIGRPLRAKSKPHAQHSILQIYQHLIFRKTKKMLRNAKK